MAPATAHALPVDGNGTTGSGCNYTDKDGYNIPIDDGQSVVVDGKTVSCSGGTITVSFAPKRGVSGLRPQVLDPNVSVSPEAPKGPPLVNANAPVLTQQR